MGAYTVAEVKAHVSAILEAGAGGEEVVVTKRGKAVARILPEKQNPMAIDWAKIDAFRKTPKASKARPHACNWNRRCFPMSPSSRLHPPIFGWRKSCCANSRPRIASCARSPKHWVCRSPASSAPDRAVYVVGIALNAPHGFGTMSAPPIESGFLAAHP